MTSFQNIETLRAVSTKDSVFGQFFASSNIDFISAEVSEKLRVTLKKKLRVPNDDIIAACWQFYQYEFNHPSVMTQQVINALADRVISDAEISDTSHLKPWVQTYDGDFGLQQVSFIKLNQKGHFQTLEFSVQK